MIMQIGSDDDDDDGVFVVGCILAVVRFRGIGPIAVFVVFLCSVISASEEAQEWSLSSGII